MCKHVASALKAVLYSGSLGPVPPVESKGKRAKLIGGKILTRVWAGVRSPTIGCLDRDALVKLICGCVIAKVY